MKRSVLLHFYVVLAWQYQPTGAKQCVKKSSGCGCDFDDGSGSIDFKPISGNSPMFSSVPSTKPSYGPFSFDFCKKFPCGDDQAYGCDTFGGGGAPIGDTLLYDYVDSAKQVTIKMSSGMAVTMITLRCKEDQAGKGEMSSVEVKGLIGTTTYTTALTSKFSCVTKDSGDKSGLSVGSILCIALLVILVVYIVVGVLVNKFVRKSEDLFPNKTFWKALPSYAKAGCLFTCNRVRGKTDAYEEI